MAFLTDFPADLARREYEASGFNCGQDECLPARQFNRVVEIDTARAAAVAQWSEGEALTRYYVSFAKVIDTLFGGDKP